MWSFYTQEVQVGQAAQYLGIDLDHPSFTRTSTRFEFDELRAAPNYREQKIRVISYINASTHFVLQLYRIAGTR